MSPAFSRRYDGEEPQRVNRWLAQSGVCSRREAESLIAEGRVLIDGEVVEDAGRKILPGQTLSLAAEAARSLADQISVVVHKPEGLVSALPQAGQVAAQALLTAEALWGQDGTPPPAEPPLAPLGRLDRDSRGLLVLSDDGVLARALIGPQSRLDKEYRVRVTGKITPERLALLRHGLELDGRRLKPAEVELIGRQRLRFVLTEGRNRQIRRMCELVDLRVTDLLRVRIGPLRLDDLPEGRWRPLKPEERAALIAQA